MKYSPSNLMDILGQSKETIRNWSVTFARFLSPTASPTSKGQHRMYTDADLEVFFLVKEMRSRGITFDEITLSLANGERALMPTSNTLAVTQQEQMTVLQTTVSTLKTELDEQRGQNKLLERQLSEAQLKIDRLVGENAVLKSKAGE